MKQLADFTTHHLVVKGIVTEADAPIYVYGFEVMFSILFTIGSIFSLAAYLGFFVETLVFFIAFFSLRIYVGGYHASTRVRCYLMSLAMIVIFWALLIVVPTQWYFPLEVVIVVVAFICIILWSPVIHEKRCTTVENIQRCRSISFFICICEMQILLMGELIFQESELLFSFGIGLFSAVISLLLVKIIG